MLSRIQQLSKKNLHSLTSYTPGLSSAAIKSEVAEENIVKLNSNENNFGPSQNVLRALSQSVCYSRYPEHTANELRQALAQHLDKAPDNFIICNGSAEALSLITQAFLEAGDEVVISQYAYQLFEIISRVQGAVCKIAPASGWSHDLAIMKNAITAKTKLVFIANPNNPTGTYLTHQQLSSFLECIPGHVIVVMDEAYYEYVNNTDFPDGLSLQQKYTNLIITRTFSKAYGLAGLRIGYAIAHKEIIDILNRVRLTFNMTSIGLVAAGVALQDQQYISDIVEYTYWERIKLEKELNLLNLEYIPSVTNFLTIDIRKDAPTVFKQLLNHGIITRPLLNYQMPNHLRVSIGTAEDNAKFLSALRSVINQ